MSTRRSLLIFDCSFFIALAALAAASASAVDAPFTYTGSFTVAEHPSIAGGVVATFTSSGTLTMTDEAKLDRVLVVGGGGGGGGLGGGGGGAVCEASGCGMLVAGATVSITVGAGGAGVSSAMNAGSNGGSSSFGSITNAPGGGGGAGYSYAAPSGGANGGGGSPDGSSNIDDPAKAKSAKMVGANAAWAAGHKGGNATNHGSSSTGCGGGGGGGGAGADGGGSGVRNVTTHNDQHNETAGNGGDGLASDITGSTVFYGGGGGGGIRRSNFKYGGVGGAGGGGHGFGTTPGSEGQPGTEKQMTSPLNATPGEANTGGGGGGGGWESRNTAHASAAGGSGVVIALFTPSGVSLRIYGSPSQVGSPLPAYGFLAGLTQGATLSLSMPETTVAGEGTATNYLAGWKLESVNEGTGARALARDSSSPDAGESPTLCNYTHDGYAEFTWLWDVRDALGASVSSVSTNGGNYLVLDVDVTGLGYEAGGSASLAVSYGLAADDLALSVAAGTVTACGTVPVMIPRLQPGTPYYFKATLTAPGGATAESQVASFTTKVFSTGMRRVEYIEGTGSQYVDTLYYPTPATHAVVDWQYMNLTVQSRVFGIQKNGLYYQAYINGSGNWAYCYSDTTDWKAVGGNKPVKVDMERHYLDFNYIDGSGNHAYTIYGTNGQVTATQSPLETSGATKTATVPLAIGANRSAATSFSSYYSYRLYSMTLDEGGAPLRAWSPVVLDNGSVALYDSVSNQYFYSCSATAYTAAGPSVPADFALVNGDPVMELTFLAAAHPRSLCIAYGPTFAGDDPAGWATTNFVATIPAGATSATAPLPANWGDDSAFVARCYFDDGTSFPLWSDAIVWRDSSAPIMSGVTADGTGGDTLVVSGALDSFGGEDCTLTVYTGTSAGSVTNVWAGLPGSTMSAPGDFSFTLFDGDTSSVRYITPAANMYVVVEAISGGKVSRSPVMAVRTKSTPAFGSATASVSHNRVTFTGKLSDLGAGGSSVVTLYVGTSNSAAALEAVEAPLTITSGDSFSISHDFGSVGVKYFWQFRAVSTTDGETASFEARTDIGNITTKDLSTYTWQAVGGDWNGDWSDAAHWSADRTPNLGYPYAADTIASFANCTLDNPVVVTVTNKYTINYLRWQGAAASDVTFVGTGTNTSSISCNTYNHSSANRVRSNSRVEFRDMTLTRKGDWEILRGHPEVTNVTVRLSGVTSTGAYFSLSSPGCRFEFLNGTYVTATKVNVGGTNTVCVIDDSFLNLSSGGFHVNADIAKASAGPVDVIIRGKSPRIISPSFYIYYSHNPDHDMNVRLEVPVGGFPVAPLQLANAIGGTTTGKKGKIHFFVEESSPAYQKSRALLENIVVAQQTGSATITTSNIWDGIGEAIDHKGRTFGAFKYGINGEPLGEGVSETTAMQILLDLQGRGIQPLIFTVQ